MAELLLLLETSGAHCSVAIAEIDGTTKQVLAEAQHNEPMKHTAMLLPLIKEAYAKTPFELQATSAVAVSTGPGSYTALRAGYSSAKGLCIALDIPIITVSTLQALASVALQFDKTGVKKILSLLPARRNDVYFAQYDHQMNTLSEPICIEADQNWWNQYCNDQRTLLVGPHVVEFCEKHQKEAYTFSCNLSASNLLEISTIKYKNGDFVDAASVEPNYVKPPFITQAKPRI